MSGFQANANSGVVVCVGNPACQDGHDLILGWMQQNLPFVLPALPSGQAINILHGNLGETISFLVGRSHLVPPGSIPFPANALNPLGGISRPEIDIVWIRLGQREEEDLAYLQEVKTTTQTSLNYADKLTTDYDKLFGTDLALTAHTRLQHIKNIMEVQQAVTPPLLLRISALAGQSPATSSKLNLLPTLVHERIGTTPVQKMMSIRSTLIGRGWQSNQIAAAAISLSDLAARLDRLALGQK